MQGALPGTANILRKAIERDELLLYYQPQMDLSSGNIVGVEALLRWHNDELGLVPPNRFIPLAEDRGLIIPIGEWVLHTACFQMESWRGKGISMQRMAVNISVRQFMHKGFASLVSRILGKTGLEPGCLELEITESLLMTDVERAIYILKSLKEIGVELAIDDFGTGYSSLNYLKRFPIDRLKIDQSFVRDIITSDEDAAITKAVIAMAHSMGLGVIAEGVETEEQLRFLEKMHCHEMQGYYLSHPLPADDIASLLMARKNIPF